MSTTMTIAAQFERQLEAANGDRAVLKRIFDEMINQAIGGLVLWSESGTGVEPPPFTDSRRPAPHFEFKDHSRYEFTVRSAD